MEALSGTLPQPRAVDRANKLTTLTCFANVLAGETRRTFASRLSVIADRSVALAAPSLPAISPTVRPMGVP
jgi:hypothetical protein